MKKWLIAIVLILVSLSFNNIEKKMAKIGEHVSLEFQKTLQAELKKALKKDGFAYAVKFCSQKAESLTTLVQKQQKKEITIARVSSKNRNPNNAPDKQDIAVLKFFENASKKKKAPSFYITIEEKKKKKYYRYYKPLYIKKICLNCHGSHISKSLQKIIKSEYPKDKATNYKLGDFRGLIKIRIPEKQK